MSESTARSPTSDSDFIPPGGGFYGDGAVFIWHGGARLNRNPTLAEADTTIADEVNDTADGDAHLVQGCDTDGDLTSNLVFPAHCSLPGDYALCAFDTPLPTGMLAPATADASWPSLHARTSWGAQLYCGDANDDQVHELAISTTSVPGTAVLLAGPVWPSATVRLEVAPDDSNLAVAFGLADLDGLATDELVVADPVAGLVGVFAADATDSHTLADADLSVSPTDGGERLAYAGAVGDLDGDGQADLVLSFPMTGLEPGTVEILYGPLQLDDSSLGAGDARISNQTNTGWAAPRIVGDVSGDGFYDLVLIYPLDDTVAEGAGSARLFYGGFRWTGTLQPDDADLVLTGIAQDDGSGSLPFHWGTADAGDLDQDGFDDLVVGWPFTNVNAEDSGTVYVFYGSGL